MVHNRFVVEDCVKRGAIFVDELDQIPDGNTVISAPRCVPEGRSEAESRDLRIFDATCPLVTKVHLEVARHCRNGHDVILIGHRGHPDGGDRSQYRANERGLGFISWSISTVSMRSRSTVAEGSRMSRQTTLSMDDTEQIVNALKRRFPDIEGPKRTTSVYATPEPPGCGKELASNCDLVLVVGSPNSFNQPRIG